jgi:hypothetical protein
MVYRGHVKKGIVVLDNGVELVDGTEVTVQPVQRRSTKHRPVKQKHPGKSKGTKPRRPPSVSSGLQRFAGAAKDLPPDAAVNLDHYLYGHPKRK